MPSQTLRTSVDTWLDEALPNSSHGKDARLRLSATGGARRYTYLYFTRPFERGVNVLSALLHVFAAGNGWGTGGPHTITVKRITQKWVESMTWNGQPAADDQAPMTFVVPNSGDGTEIVMDITNMLERVANGAPWYGVRLVVDTNGDKALYSSDATPSENRPILELNWGKIPHQPQDLVPSDGQVVSLATPLLNWRYQDDKGESAQSAYRIRTGTGVDAQNNLTGVFSDTGWVSAGETQAVCPFSAVNGVDYYWQVQVKDDSANHRPSAWSDPAHFIRRAKGSVVISPVSTHDTSPPVTWTFTPGPGGALQDLVSLILYEADRDPGTTDTINMLSYDDSNFEGGLGSWVSGANCAIAQVTTTSYRNNGSMRMTASSAADMNARTPIGNNIVYRVHKSAIIGAQARFLAGSIGRSVRVDLLFYDLNATLVQTSIGTATTDATGTWTRATNIVQAPNSAKFVVPRVYVIGPANAEVHYVDAVMVEELATLATPVSTWVPGWKYLTTYHEIWRKARFQTSTVSYTLPDKDGDGNRLVRFRNRNYKVEVRVWDTYDRVKTAGDFDYVFDTEVFQFAGDATQPGVDTLNAVVNVDGSITFTWHRATQPDFFALEAGTSAQDLETVFAQLDPLNFIAPDLGAGWYRMNYWRARPGITLLYEMKAVVISSGIRHQSVINDTTWATSTIEGIWLINEDTDGAVAIVGNTDAGAIPIGEDATVYNPAGSRVPVKVTQSVRGYEGHITGMLTKYAGQSAQQYKERLENWKGLLNQTFHLIMADYSLQIRITNLSIGPAGKNITGRPSIYRVEMDFIQVGRYTFDLQQGSG